MKFYSAGRKGWDIIRFSKKGESLKRDIHLILRPFGREEVHVPLGPAHDGSMEYRAAEEYGVFAGLTYEVVLDVGGLSNEVSVMCELNGTPVACTWANGMLQFGGNRANGRLFLDCYGYVQLFFAVICENGESMEACTPYLPVFLSKGTDCQAVYAMLAYVNAQYEDLLYEPAGHVRSPAGVQQGERRSASVCIPLLAHIAGIFETTLPAFLAGSKYRRGKQQTAGEFAKMQAVSEAELCYIAQHPDQLRPVVYPTGIRYGRHYFQPCRTLVPKHIQLYHIYENRMVFGFLQAVYLTVYQMRHKIAGLIQRFPRMGTAVGGSLGPGHYFYGAVKEALCMHLQQLICLSTRFESLYRIYQNAWGIVPQPLCTLPEPTAVFLSSPHYQSVYRAMERWFLYGRLDLTQEELLLSFSKIESLYEYYILAKLHSFFIRRAFPLWKKERYIYSVPRGKYCNTWCCNTFYYSCAQTEVTLYYQPVISCGVTCGANQIGLYRNTTVSLPGEGWKERRGRYYVPDFLLKIIQPDKTLYLILDAKFSTVSNVKAYVLVDAVYKYLFSIGLLHSNDVLAGLCIVNGKIEAGSASNLVNIHDMRLPGEQDLPKTLLLTMAETGENTEELHQSLLEQVIGPFLGSGTGAAL